MDLSINSTSLYEYLKIKFDKFIATDHISPTFNNLDEIIIQELNTLGINTLKELDNIIIELDKYPTNSTNFTGLLRNILIIHDADRYFFDAWNNKWHGINKMEYNFYIKNGVQIDKLISEFDLFLMPE